MTLKHLLATLAAAALAAPLAQAQAPYPLELGSTSSDTC
jgi:hypothetical protein